MRRPNGVVKTIMEQTLTGHIDTSELGAGSSDLKDGPVGDIGDMGQHEDVEVIAEFAYTLERLVREHDASREYQGLDPGSVRHNAVDSIVSDLARREVKNA